MHDDIAGATGLHSKVGVKALTGALGAFHPVRRWIPSGLCGVALIVDDEGPFDWAHTYEPATSVLPGGSGVRMPISTSIFVLN